MISLIIFLVEMKPIIFRTDKGNCYLYSPAKKSLVPLPFSVYEDIKIKGNSHSVIYNQIEKFGYLDSWHDDFGGIVYSDDIIESLTNLSQVVFETTTACNLRCRYCCYGEGYDTFDSRRNQHGNLDFYTAKTILDYLVERFSSSNETRSTQEPFAISFYGGEPLMNFSVVKDIVEYAEDLHFRNRKLSFTMTTNATLLSKYADFLYEHNFKLLISLDGNKKHNVYRTDIQNKETFETVIKNLNTVKESYPLWFSTFRYNSVYTDISDVNEIVSWFQETLGKVPNFSPLHEPTIGSPEYEQVKAMLKRYEIPENIRFDNELITQSPLLKRILEFSYRLFDNVYTNESFLFENDSPTFPTGTCIPFSKRMFVTFDGKIHPCEKVNREKPLGVIEEDRVVIDVNKVARDFNVMTGKMRSMCQECYLQQCCTKCMLCFDKGKCSNFTNSEHFAKILAETISYIETHPGIVATLENKIITK